MKPFSIYNTLSHSVEEVKPQKPPVVTMYSCGPTVYLPQHLGNLRTYLSWDFLRRAMELNGFQVRHVINVTDVGHMTSDEDEGEDKIEKTARAEGKSPLEVATFYLTMFQRDLATLNAETPMIWCRATDHIGEMLALIQRILASGMAYVAKSGVYFDVEKYRGPDKRGKLSRQSLDEQHAGQRLEHSPDKKSPHDFALWVLRQPHHLMQWDSPWGRGYPGWHIECSAMSMKYLGETLDIHTGGMDHIPIHHENEIAQSESATGHRFANYFVHSAFLVGKDGAKISKSAGKFPLLSEMTAQGIDALAFRVFCLGAKYRSELMLSEEALHAAQSNLEYLREFARNLDTGPESEFAAEYRDRFIEALNDDLNTPRALAVALEMAAEGYRRKDLKVSNTLAFFDRVLGLGLEKVRGAAETIDFPADIQKLIEERAAARQGKNFKRADELRAELEARGYEVKDGKGGTATYRHRGA